MTNLFLKSLGKSAAIGAHFLDHPVTIRAAEKGVPYVYPLGAALLLGADLYRADGWEEKKKILIRDSMVLGATVAGTMWATKKMMKEEEAFAVRQFKNVGKLTGQYSKALQDKISTLIGKPQEELTFKEFISVFGSMWKETQSAIQQAKNPKDKFRALIGLRKDLTKMFPLAEEAAETIWDEFKKAGAFFSVGLVSVASGVGGGLLANVFNKGTKEEKVNIFKEAVFQFVANIALCAIGAILGLTVVNTLGLKNRVFRIPIVSAGLTLGIVGGGQIANFVGKTLINPFFDWLDEPNRQWQGLKNKIHEAYQSNVKGRKIEFSDIILHLDDLPTAFAIAGMKVMGPFIPPFFAFSGYRAGIGYRNVHDDTIQNAGTSQNTYGALTTNNHFQKPSRLMTTNSVFYTFYEEQRTGHF
ncbi:MAG: hypothetical protein K2X66_06580 [Cyanobacteria bacterium]|nr:hypothetical protein [Cyanobacteriota bacterium]